MVLDALVTLALIAVLAVTPAVLFLLFWRFLVYLRDDALIEDVRLNHGIDLTAKPGIPFLPTRSGTGDTPPSMTTCSACGTYTFVGHHACVSCGDRLES